MSGDADIVTEVVEDAVTVPETALAYRGDQVLVELPERRRRARSGRCRSGSSTAAACRSSRGSRAAKRSSSRDGEAVAAHADGRAGEIAGRARLR